MKFFLIIPLALLFVHVQAQQTTEEKLQAAVIALHQAMVNKNVVTINQHTDKALTYGHSNGWVENKKTLISNLETGLISYQKFAEDSVVVQLSGNVASVRFKADIDATLKGVSSNFKLQVLEVWIRKANRWVLFARQAVKQV
ncbi:MAG TPA: nuclear transport factor 2 family protein [Ferruginibacter sp.]|nr:nuclear transport factor 2 family protein [Ferruginibacter sp.]HMP21316.1 nuclear transport factor 2 family protein [Ferruginibacter sp.]